MSLIYKDLSYRLQGCLMEVYNTLGPGFREETYKKALIEELKRQKIKFSIEYPIQI
ncbi:MAG: GxxExxY protein [bacterium]|nr:GxxExxY protein [bacterium]